LDRVQVAAEMRAERKAQSLRAVAEQDEEGASGEGYLLFVCEEGAVARYRCGPLVRNGGAYS
jgi:hypothetical protein